MQSGFVGCQSTRQWTIEINAFHRASVLAAVTEEVGEVFAGSFALLLCLRNLVLASSKVFNVLREAVLEVGRRYAQNATNLGRNPASIGVHIVQFREFRSEFT